MGYRAVFLISTALRVKGAIVIRLPYRGLRVFLRLEMEDLARRIRSGTSGVIIASRALANPGHQTSCPLSLFLKHRPRIPPIILLSSVSNSWARRNTTVSSITNKLQQTDAGSLCGIFYTSYIDYLQPRQVPLAGLTFFAIKSPLDTSGQSMGFLYSNSSPVLERLSFTSEREEWIAHISVLAYLLPPRITRFPHNDVLQGLRELSNPEKSN